jgi:hypothetical protein
MAEIKNEYVRQVLQARQGLARAKSDYSKNLAEAKKAVKEAERTYDKRIKSLKSDKERIQTDYASSLKSYANIKLYNDRIEFDGRTLKFDHDIQVKVEPAEQDILNIAFSSAEGTIQATGDANKEELARNFASAVLSAQADYPQKLAAKDARISQIEADLDVAMNATEPIRQAERNLDEVTRQVENVTQAENNLKQIEASGSPTDIELLRQTDKSKSKTKLLIIAAAIIVVLLAILVVFFLNQ